MKRILGLLPLTGVGLLAAGLLLPSMYQVTLGTRADPHAWPYTLLPSHGGLESNLPAYLLAAVVVGGGLLVALGLLRGRSGGFGSGYLFGGGLVGLATFLGLSLLLVVPENRPEGEWSAGPGYFLGLAGALMLIASSLILRPTNGPETSERPPKSLPFLGVVLLAVGLVAPLRYRNIPRIDQMPTRISEPIVSFDGYLAWLLPGYLLGAVLVAGGLCAAVTMVRKGYSGFVSGFGLVLGLVSLGKFLGPILLILEGPNEAPYPEGPFSVGVGFFLGIAGALLLVLAFLPKRSRWRRLSEGAPDRVGIEEVANS